jgi:hypothetical protein
MSEHRYGRPELGFRDGRVPYQIPRIAHDHGLLAQEPVELQSRLIEAWMSSLSGRPCLQKRVGARAIQHVSDCGWLGKLAHRNSIKTYSCR